MKINFNKYKNIQLTKKADESNCITHSGRFHIDDVISTIFLSKIKKNIILNMIGLYLDFVIMN